ncbi:uncharacterized protein LOC123675857 [Harmonia axyridis]|uniref:uncharacterized protein LOC123675857 n=1 Tax=Harmonia axyridis TaxID=115357 RepID=UPI001E2773E3|nr:uncharacterized protein LOC123675857 [Harmonia axyridis]
MFEVPILRKVTIIYLTIMICNLLLTVVFFYLHWDFRLLIKNGFCLITTCFGALLISEASFSADTHFPIEKIKRDMWPFSDADPQVFRRIQNDIKFLRYTRILLIILLLISTSILPISGDIREFAAILYLFDDIERRFWYHYLKFGILIFKLIFSLTFSSPLFMMLYSVGDNAYSLMIVREKIRSIEEIFGTKDTWFQNEAYQKYVELTLMRCIKEHVLIKRYHKITASILERDTPSVSLVVVLLFTSFYFSVKMNMNNEIMMKSMFIVMLVIFFAYLFIRCGQLLKDESEDLYRDLCECPWFLWNKHNKSLYIMFLINTKEPITIRSLSVDLDCRILVRLARTTMSLLTALQKLDA